jgi:hypothetical protein
MNSSIDAHGCKRLPESVHFGRKFGRARFPRGPLDVSPCAARLLAFENVRLKCNTFQGRNS